MRVRVRGWVSECWGRGGGAVAVLQHWTQALLANTTTTANSSSNNNDNNDDNNNNNNNNSNSLLQQLARVVDVDVVHGAVEVVRRVELDEVPRHRDARAREVAHGLRDHLDLARHQQLQDALLVEEEEEEEEN